jgi:hypothetical protein
MRSAATPPPTEIWLLVCSWEVEPMMAFAGWRALERARRLCAQRPSAPTDCRSGAVTVSVSPRSW